MKNFCLLVCFFGLIGCKPPSISETKFDSELLAGGWFKIEPNGALTDLYDSTIYTDGTFVSHTFSCSAKTQVAISTRTGKWTLDGAFLNILFDDEKFDNENSDNSRLIVTKLTQEQLNYDHAIEGWSFAYKRRWVDLPYDCSTTKQEIDDHSETYSSKGDSS